MKRYSGQLTQRKHNSFDPFEYYRVQASLPNRRGDMAKRLPESQPQTANP
jgi:hypothetical protein